jgi:hypothetical protein
MEYAVVVKHAKVHIHKADNSVILIYTIDTCTVFFRRTFSRSTNQPNRYSTARLVIVNGVQHLRAPTSLDSVCKGHKSGASLICI